MLNLWRLSAIRSVGSSGSREDRSDCCRQKFPSSRCSRVILLRFAVFHFVWFLINLLNAGSVDLELVAELFLRFLIDLRCCCYVVIWLIAFDFVSNFVFRTSSRTTCCLNWSHGCSCRSFWRWYRALQIILLRNWEHPCWGVMSTCSMSFSSSYCYRILFTKAFGVDWLWLTRLIEFCFDLFDVRVFV